jgi:hypothetical protein
MYSLDILAIIPFQGGIDKVKGLRIAYTTSHWGFGGKINALEACLAEELSRDLG